MATIKGQMKVQNGANFDVIYNETSADVVKYSDTTVAGVLGGLSTTYVKQVSGKDLSTNDFTNAYKQVIDDLGTTYAKKSDIADVFHYKGTVANFSSIPTDTAVGDVWNIAADGGTDENGIAIMAGDNVAKTATGFDVLAGTVDLTGYVQKDGNKKLSTNDFTDAYKTKLDNIDTDASVGMSFYIGTTQPADANTIWFDTTGY